MAPAEPSIRYQVAKGASWTIAMRIAIRSLGIVSTIVLVRILAPEDFGLVALAMTLRAGAAVPSNLNLRTYIIQAHDPDRSVYDTVWTLSILRGLLIAAVLILIAGPAASFFGDSRLELIIYAIAALPIINGFRNIGTVDFQKHFIFSKDFSLMVGVKVVSFFVTIAAAIALKSFWALIVGLFAANFAGLLLSYCMHSFRPRLCLAGAREIISFAKWFVLRNILNFIASSSDTFLLGRLTDPATLGIYTIAREISTLASSELLAPVNRVMLPGFSKITAEMGNLRDAYIHAQTIVFAIGAPVAIGVWLVAEPAVLVFLGPDWSATIPLVKVISLFALIQIIGGNAGSVFIAISRPQLQVPGQIAKLIVLLPALYWSITTWGVIGAAWSVTASAAAMVVVNQVLLRSAVGIPITLAYVASARTFVSVAAMFALIVSLRGLLGGSIAELPVFVELVATTIIGASAYIGMHLLLWFVSGRPDGPERKFLQIRSEFFQEWAHRTHGSS